MAIAINPIFPVIGAQGVAPNVVLQPGTVIDATVLKVLDANLVRIAIANLSIEVLSEVQLKAGQALQLAVTQTPQGVKLSIVPQPGENIPVGQAQSAPSGSSATAQSNSSQGTTAQSGAPLSGDAGVRADPATNVAPNIAAPKIAPQIDAATDPRAARPLTNLEALVVSAVVQSAAAKQASLAPLFANLNVAATSHALPPALQEAAAKLLATRPDLNGNISGEDIKAAFEKSGLFLEQSLASRANVNLDESSNAQSALTSSLSGEHAETPDLKAALIVFRQTVASWLGDATPAQQTTTQSQATSQSLSSSLSGDASEATPSSQTPQSQTVPPQGASPSIVPSQGTTVQYDEILLPQASLPVADEGAGIDPKIQIFSPSDSLPNAAARVTNANTGLASLQEVLQAFPKGVQDAVKALLDAEAIASSSLKSPVSTGSSHVSLDGSDVPPPPFRGAAPSAQPIAAPSLAPDAEPVAVARHLIDDADAAIARQTLLQVASLPDRIDLQAARPDLNAPRWNFEIPFATSQGTAVAQFEISRDGNGVSVDPSRKVWKARFSLNVEPTGPVHALVTLSGDRASVRMWAERPATAAQLRANAPQLSHALREAALEPGDIVIGDGAPPQPAQPTAGHFLDRAL